MDFLIDPNVSYVLLILGFLTAVLALFSPGTGILEIGALITLALSAYGIVNLPVNPWALAVMALALVPFLIALRQPQRARFLLLGLATLTFVIGSAFLFRGEGWAPAVSPILILILTPLGLGFTWITVTKVLEAAKARPVFDLRQLIGMTGQASSDIRGQGTVYINGEEWSATSKTYIPAGSTVRVKGRKGLSLEVEIDHS